MSALQDLPTEVLQQIIGEVIPDDVINFAVCCKDVNALAEARLKQHKQCCMNYTELRYSGCFRHEDQDHPVKLLRRICLDKHIACYPKFLSIACCQWPDSIEDMEEADDDWLNEDEMLAKQQDASIVQSVFDEFDSVVDNKLCQSLWYNDNEIRTWRQLLKRGSKGVILCILLLLLPNLEANDLTHSDFEDNIFFTMLDLIVQTSQEPNPSGPVALTKLSKATLQGSEPNIREGYDGENCQTLAHFAALPSMRTISTNFVHGGNFFKNFVWPYEPHLSNVTVLDLCASCIEPKCLSQLLRSIKCLKSFSYDYFPQSDEGGDVTMCSIIEVLLEHARSTLECVSLPTLYPSSICSDDAVEFKEFEVLKEIRFDSSGYLRTEEMYEVCYFNESWPSFTEWRDGIDRLVDILPASVEKVVIDGDVDTSDMTLLLKDIPIYKKECFPRLRSITFTECNRSVNRKDRVWGKIWRKACSDVGVRLIL